MWWLCWGWWRNEGVGIEELKSYSEKNYHKLIFSALLISFFRQFLPTLEVFKDNLTQIILLKSSSALPNTCISDGIDVSKTMPPLQTRSRLPFSEFSTRSYMRCLSPKQQLVVFLIDSEEWESKKGIAERNSRFSAAGGCECFSWMAMQVVRGSDRWVN